MDYALIDRIVEDWRLNAPPIRPSEALVEVFRSALPRGRKFSAMVMGATPELVDMLLCSAADRVVSFDAHPETIEAMRRLAGEDWSRVEIVVGDWCNPRPEFEFSFDLILCEGGLLFLAFPERWRQVFNLVRTYLKPGGRMLYKTFSVSPTVPSFLDQYAQAIARFEADRPGLSSAQETRRFMEMVSQLKNRPLSGAVDPQGRVLWDRADAATRWMADDLRQRFPGPRFGRTIEAILGRSNAIGLDGAAVIAVPPLELVQSLIRECSLETEIVLSEHRPSVHSFMVAAIKPG